MKPMSVTFVMLALMTASGVAAAAGDPQRGQEKSQVCQACHGERGASPDPTYPSLAGQYADYLEFSLKRYRSGKRVNVLMNGLAANLSDEDIEDLAAWYASQDGLQTLARD